MKPSFTELEKEQIQKGKKMLRHLWKQSKTKMTDLMAFLDEQGETTKKTTLSMWFSANENNFVRPKEHLLPLLLEKLLPGNHQEILDELAFLFAYNKGPLPSEEIRNLISLELDESLGASLQNNQQNLSIHMEALDELLEEIEPKILEYDKNYPVIRVEKGNLQLLRQLLGKDRASHKEYECEDEYEIPLTRIQSFEAMTEILNHLNEGSRLLRDFIERDILEDGYLGNQAYRIEDFVAYCWEISDRLLYNNLLCKSVPVLKRTLLRVMATCWGIRYILANQTGSASEIQFQNILLQKGKGSEADVNCFVAVYMGLLARQYIRQGSPHRIHQGVSLFKKSRDLLLRHHEQLNTEQEIFYYKKELANLCYDIGAFLLWHQRADQHYPALIKAAMQMSAQYYEQVLGTVNLFYQGLTEQRAQHVRGFYAIAKCWTASKKQDAVAEINKLSSGQELNQHFWFIQVVCAIGHGILWYRSQPGPEKDNYRTAAENHLNKALLVSGVQEQTNKELNDDFILHQLFPSGKIS